MAISPKGSTVFSGSDDNEVKVIWSEEGKVLASVDHTNLIPLSYMNGITQLYHHPIEEHMFFAVLSNLVFHWVLNATKRRLYFTVHYNST